jgi:RNA polymerase sigma-70 factor (ECF subfamily)
VRIREIQLTLLQGLIAARKAFWAPVLLLHRMTTQNAIQYALSTFEKETLPHWSALYRTAYSLLGSQGEAEDAVQETYLQAWKSFHGFEVGTNCRAWMSAILFNVVRHYRRKWSYRYCLTIESGLFEETIAAAVETHEYLTDPDILAALGQLPKCYSEAVVLADSQDLSYKEVSDTLGCPIGTVMSRISRGREMLRRTLAPVARERGIFRK